MRYLSCMNKGIGLRGLSAVLLLAVATTSVFAQATAPASNDKKPKITVEEPVKDFGVLYAGPALSHTFKIFNTGGADLHITKVTPGCSCTVAGKYPEVLKPGESGDIPFTVNTSSFRGPFTRMPTIFSDDPSTPELKLTMKGEAKRYIDVQPPNVIFNALGGKEPQVRTVKITNNTETPMKLTMQSPAVSDAFKMELTETQPGKEYELKVTAGPPWGEPGMKRANIVLQTTVEKEKQVNVYVSGTLPIRIDVQPAIVRVMKTTPTPPASAYPPPLPGEQAASMPVRKTIRIVRFSNNGEAPVKVTEATTNDPLITATIKEYQQGKMFLINLEMPVDYLPPTSGKKLTIKTDDAEKPVIEVPITGEMAPVPPQAMPPSPPTTQQAQQAQQPPRRPPTGTVDSLVGKDAPEFKLTTESGKTITNKDIGAQVAVLDFFSPRCGFCRKQMPIVDAVRKEYEAKGVRFIYVAQKMGTAPTVKDCTQMMEQMKVSGELAMDAENKIGGELFHANGYPTMVILDKSGKVATVNVGALPDLADRMKKQIDALLAGKPIPADLLPSKTPPSQAQQMRPSEAMVGKDAPEFALSIEGGKSISNKDIGAQVAVLDFFSPRCGFCRKQMPVVDAVRKEYEAKGVRFVYVAQRMGTAPTVQDCTQMMEQMKVSGELAMDPENKIGGQVFHATGFPTMVILDKKGKVAAVNVGAIPDLSDRMKKQLDALLAGKPIPENLLPAKGAAPPAGNQAQQMRPAETMVGKDIPEFKLDTESGKPIAHNNLGAAVAVLDFFSPRCGFCRKQMPVVDKIRKDYEAKGVRFLYVGQAMGAPPTKQDCSQMMEQLGVKGDLAMDAENKVGGQVFKTTGYPTMVILDKSGKVAAVNVGARPDLAERVPKQLDALLAGKPIPADLLPAVPAPTAKQ